MTENAADRLRKQVEANVLKIGNGNNQYSGGSSEHATNYSQAGYRDARPGEIVQTPHGEAVYNGKNESGEHTARLLDGNRVVTSHVNPGVNEKEQSSGARQHNEALAAWHAAGGYHGAGGDDARPSDWPTNFPK